MHLDFSMSRFGVEGSLELLVSAVGVDGALSSALDACKLKWQLHIQAHILRTPDSKQLLHSHKKVTIILMKLAFSANKNNTYIVIRYNNNNKNYDNLNHQSSMS